LKAERRNCQTKEEQDKIWSRVPKGGPILRLTGRLTVGRKTTPTPTPSPTMQKAFGPEYDSLRALDTSHSEYDGSRVRWRVVVCMIMNHPVS
jgi:hypothetical protein